ncbi:hypothetical protein UT300012_22310 [Paraclostridium bifermentans]
MKTDRLDLLDGLNANKDKKFIETKPTEVMDKPPKVDKNNLNIDMTDVKRDYVGEYFKSPNVKEEALLCYFKEFKKEGGKSNYVKSFMRSVFETLELEYTDYEEDVYYIYDKVCEELAERFVNLFDESIDNKKNIDEEKIQEALEDGKYSEYYEESAFKNKMRDFGSRLSSKALYPAVLLFNLLQDKNTPFEVRGTIIAGLGYFICPIDLIPDIVPVLGMTDDIGALTLAVQLVKQHITDDLEYKTKQDLNKWFKSS